MTIWQLIKRLIRPRGRHRTRTGWYYDYSTTRAHKPVDHHRANRR